MEFEKKKISHTTFEDNEEKYTIFRVKAIKIENKN